jgi:hypothetical protein
MRKDFFYDGGEESRCAALADSRCAAWGFRGPVSANGSSTGSADLGATSGGGVWAGCGCPCPGRNACCHDHEEEE